MKSSFIILLLIIIPIIIYSQRWKRLRYEFVYGIGYCNFLGELGGGAGKGGQFIFSVKDMDINASRPAVFLGIRYKIVQRIALKFNLIYTNLYGNDKYSESAARRLRNQSFRSPLLEQSLNIELSFIKERIGSRFTISNIRNLKKLHINSYVFIGFGGFWFKPITKINGFTIEGQSPQSKGDDYSNYQLVIPFGIGFKYGINRFSNIGFEYGNRFTFTDYIDNLNDKSSGNKSNDNYMLINVIFSYKFKTTKNGLPKF